MKKRICALLVCGILCSVLSVAVSAASYKGYTYNYWDEAVPSQIGYQPETVYTGTELGTEIGNLSEPKDLCVTEDRQVYILDSGNNRVVVLDEKLGLRKIIQEFTDQSGKITLDNPTGIFVDQKNLIYIADPNNACVWVSDQNGHILHKLEKPQTNMLAEDLEFKPQKVLADSAGTIYVTASGVYQGALLYTEQGEFDGFYGSNTVEVTGSLLLDRFWKNILTSEQADMISKYIPEEFTSFDINEKDFIFTVTQTATVKKKVKKLNPMGSDILEAEEFGELEELYINGKLSTSRFVDIAVSDSGIINVLDQQNNRIFQYDPEGELLFISGGAGTQQGTFLNPSAIEVLEDKLLILDAQKSNLTVMSPSAFGKKVLEAVYYYNDGEYGKANGIWEEVLKYDHNYMTAYISIGKSLMAEEKFKEAAEYFKLGNDREGNSDAFQSYRNELLQKYFPWICLGVVLIIALLICFFNRKGKKTDSAKHHTRISPFKFLLHPVDNAEEMKLKKAGSLPISCLILGLWFLATIFRFALTGFRFNTNNVDTMNIWLLFLGTVPIFAVGVVSNWGVCTLMDGKGKMKDIWISASYCLIPYVSCNFLYVALSHLLVEEETVFLQWISLLGIIWSACMLLGVLSGIHDYSFGQTILSVLLTVVGMLIVVFLVLLVATLVQQAYAFVNSIANELIYRIR